jgi:deoxyribonuclease-2
MLIHSFFIIVIFLSTLRADLSCLDENGNALDWWLISKVPELKHNQDDQKLKRGSGYYFMQPSDPQWHFSSLPISDDSSAFAKTIAPIYASPTPADLSYVMFNDEPPGKKECTSAHGHVKGVLMFDNTRAVWIVHSVPHAPNVTNTPTWYPNTGYFNGQSAFCVTFDITQSGRTPLDEILEQLQYYRPCFYAHALAESQASRYGELNKLVQGDHVTQAPWNRSVELVTIGGQRLLHFAKYVDFGADIYKDWMSQALGAPLLTETWQNGDPKNRIPSSCDAPNVVENVEGVSLPPVSASSGNVVFNETIDHSKWALTVALSSSRRPLARCSAPNGGFCADLVYPNGGGGGGDEPEPWVCVGDINREYTQYKRPGGQLCILHAGVHQTYLKSVAITEPCPRRARARNANEPRARRPSRNML